MAERVVGSDVLTNQDTSIRFATHPPSENGIVTLSNELLESLKDAGLKYLHYTSNGEAGIAVVASRNRTINNDLPDITQTLSEQIKQGLIGISQINASGIRLGENGRVYKAEQIIRGEQKIESGAVLQEGIDITNPPAPDGPRTLLPRTTAVAPPVPNRNKRGPGPN